MVRYWICALPLWFTTPVVAADESLARFDHVVVEPAKASVLIGSVTMTFAPATRKAGAYATDYSAKVFPFFFLGEEGKLVLDAPDQTLQRLARGESVDFSGRGVSTSGAERRFEGRATPTNATGGNLKVHAFVSNRIDLVFNMTYRFVAAPP